MVSFLTIFISLYAAIHALVFLRLRVLLPDRPIYPFLLAFFFLLMIFTPLVVFSLDRSGHDTAAKITAWFGLNWMGFIFPLFLGSCLLVAFDAISWLLNATNAVHLPTLSGRTPAAILVVVGCLVSVIGFYQSSHLTIDRVTIDSKKIPEAANPLKIALISDVHIGLMAGESRLREIVRILKAEKPDILISAGDFIDSSFGDRNLADILAEIDVPDGKYAVTGNHEYYRNLPKALEFTRQSGFTLLRDQAITVPGLINIVGVDDPASGTPTHEAALLASKQNGLFTLLLKHRPDIGDRSSGLFDLQLSGHTHGGQIWPFGYVVKLQYPYLDGLYNLDNGAKIYTSQGTGTWGPQMRFLTPPMVTIITLENPDKPK